MRALVQAELRGNRRRFVAPAVAVAIAVAFVTVTFGATSAMKSSLSAAVAARATLSDVVVTPPGEQEGYLPEGTTRTVAAVAGVQRAEPVFGGGVDAQWPDGADFTAAVSIPVEPRLRWMTMTTGRFPAADDEIAVDDSTAADLSVRPGDTLRVTGQSGGPRVVRVVGIADLGATPTIAGLRTILGTPSGVSGWTGGRPAEIDVLAAGGTDPAVLRDRIRAAVGSSAVARTGPEEATAAAASLTNDVDILGGLLLVFAAVALVVSTIVISNTFAALLAGRLRALALLRCVGATRRQIFRSVLAETATVGAVASAAGVAAGYGLTAAGVAILRARFESMEGMSVDFAAWMLVVPFILGVAVALSAALLPARRATRVAPLAAMRPAEAVVARRASRMRTWLGVIVLVIGAGSLVAAASSEEMAVGMVLGIAGGTVSLVGVLLLGPALVPALARLLGLAVSRWLPARLAVGNAVRNPVRAASTSVALLVGVSLVTMMSVGASSVTAAGTHAINGQYPLDIAVSAPDGGSLPAGLADRLARVSGTAKTLTVTGATVPATAGASKAGAGSRQLENLDVAGADPAGVVAVWRGDDPGLSPGVALVPGGDVAERLHLEDGDEIRLGAAGTTIVERVRVSSIPAVIIASTDMARIAPGAPVRHVLARAADDVEASAYRTAIRNQVKGISGVRVEGAITQRAELADWMAMALRVAIGLLAAALLIAVVGIANTLALSVLERSRELAMQRALGMTKRQLRASLTVEALLLSAVGALLGLVLGVGYGWAGARALLGGVVSDIPFSVKWSHILGMVALVLFTGVVAAVLPTRRAARYSPTQALGAE